MRIHLLVHEAENRAPVLEHLEAVLIALHKCLQWLSDGIKVPKLGSLRTNEST